MELKRCILPFSKGGQVECVCQKPLQKFKHAAYFNWRFLTALPFLALLALPSLFPAKGAAINLAWYLVLVVILFSVEVVLYWVPGVSLSSLLIAMIAFSFGFVPTLVMSLIAILTAHFLIRKDITLFVPDILTLIPMVAFAVFVGPEVIKLFGWGIFGLTIGIIKWGIALPVGFVMGKNVPKRVLNIILEPPINFLIFWKLRFLFEFLF